MAASASIDAARASRPGVHAVITAADMPGGPPIVPMRLQPLPEFKPFEQPVIAARQGALCRRADRGGAGRQRRRSARTRSRRSRSRSSRCRRSPTGTSAAQNASAAVRGRRHQPLAGVPTRARATPTRRSRTRPICGARRFRTERHYGAAPWSRAACMAEWDAASGPAHGLGRRQGAVLQPPHPRRRRSACRRRHRDDRERRRRRLRRARRVLSGGFPDPVRGAPRRPPGEMDRGPPRESDGDEPRARGGVRSRDRLRARRHHPRRCAARSTPTWAPICAPTARSAPRNVAQFMAGPYRVPNVELDVALWMTNKTPVGTYRGPGPVRGQFLPRAAVRHGGARPRHRPRSNSAAGIWSREAEHALSGRRPCSRPTPRTSSTAATISVTLDRCLKSSAGRRRRSSQGKLIDGRYHGLGVVLLHRGRRRRPEGERAARDQRRRHDLGLSRLVVGRAGRRDDRSRRSPPTRWKCRSSASATSITARPPM